MQDIFFSVCRVSMDLILPAHTTAPREGAPPYIQTQTQTAREDALYIQTTTTSCTTSESHPREFEEVKESFRPQREGQNVSQKFWSVSRLQYLFVKGFCPS